MTRRFSKQDCDDKAPIVSFSEAMRALEDPKLARPLIRRAKQKPRTRPNRHLADDLQMSVAKTFRDILPPEVLWFAIPNGGLRNEREAERLKSMGVRAGISDLCLMWVASDGLREIGWLELKIKPNKVIDGDEQDRHMKIAAKLGHRTGVAYCHTDVMALLINWQVPQRKVS